MVSQSKDKVFDVLAESCNEVKARIENSDKDNYQITGKSPKFQIILKDYEPGAMIDVYDFSKNAPDSRFIFSLFRALAKRIPLDSSFKIYAVDKIATIEEDKRQRRIHDISLLSPSEYDIDLDKGSDGQLKNIHKLITIPTHKGNTLEFKKNKKSNSLLTIRVKDIEAVNTIAQSRGSIRKKNDMLLEIIYNDDRHNKKCIKFNVEDRYVNVIQQQIELFMEAEKDASFQRTIKIALHPDLCNICITNKFQAEFHGEKLCSDCFIKKYGRALLYAKSAEYYGGHKAYLAGGMFSRFELGALTH